MRLSLVEHDAVGACKSEVKEAEAALWPQQKIRTNASGQLQGHQKNKETLKIKKIDSYADESDQLHKR